MDIIALLFFAVNAVALWAVPRKYAPIPLLAGCCYMTLGQGIELGPISLPIFRMLMAVGLLRVIVKGEKIAGSLNKIDKIVIALGVWLFFASFFHDGIEGSGPIFILGFLFNLLLTYFLIRVWTRTPEEVEELVIIIAILLVPVALAMILEKVTAKNLFSVFGGVPGTLVRLEPGAATGQRVSVWLTAEDVDNYNVRVALGAVLSEPEVSLGFLAARGMEVLLAERRADLAAQAAVQQEGQ